MNLKKLHHVAIIGSDYAKSKRFYVDLLGFRIIRENHRPERPKRGKYSSVCWSPTTIPEASVTLTFPKAIVAIVIHRLKSKVNSFFIMMVHYLSSKAL